MNPCELNWLITAITNHLFCKLTKEEFACLSVFLNELSKAMFATSLFRDTCCNINKNNNQCTSTGNTATTTETTNDGDILDGDLIHEIDLIEFQI